MYTIKSSTRETYAPSDLTFSDAAKWARAQAVADMTSLGLSEADAYIESAAHNDDGLTSAYRIVRRYTHTQQGHIPAAEVGQVEVVEV